MQVQVFVVEDHSFLLQTYIWFFSRDLRYDLIGHSVTGADAIAQLAEITPQVVILDMMLPDMSGFEVAKSLKQRDPRIKILAVSAAEDPEFLAAVKTAGIDGFLFKGRGFKSLCEAIDALVGVPALR